MSRILTTTKQNDNKHRNTPGSKSSIVRRILTTEPHTTRNTPGSESSIVRRIPTTEPHTTRNTPGSKSSIVRRILTTEHRQLGTHQEVRVV